MIQAIAHTIGSRLRRRRAGMVLVVVLVVVTMLALAGFTFAELMFTERKAAVLLGRDLQSRAAAESGIELLNTLLGAAPAEQMAQGRFHDLPEVLDRQLLPDDESGDTSGFVVISPAASADELPRVGIEDESAKLHLSAVAQWEEESPGAGREALLSLPGMTEAVADAVLDWMDADDMPREQGAERDTYSQLVPPYAPRGAPPSDLEELLLVRGVTRELLYGIDTNRNGRIDAEEGASASSPAGGVASEMPLRGWSQLLTVHSAERNVASDGSRRIDLNSDNLAGLYYRLARVFDESWTRFIVAYRQAGPYTGFEPAARDASGSLDLGAAGTHHFESLLDLVGAKVRIKLQGRSRPVVLKSPIAADDASRAEDLRLLLDKATLDAQRRTVGRINVNLAPAAVLAAVPEIDSELAEQIVARRPARDRIDAQTPLDPIWLLTEELVDDAAMRQLLVRLCGRGDVVSGQVIGRAEGSRVGVRYEFVLDATTEGGELLCWKDLQALGTAYPTPAQADWTNTPAAQPSFPSASFR